MTPSFLLRMGLRTKLTLIFAGVMACVLGAIGAFLFFQTKADLDGGIRQALAQRAGQLAAVVRDGSGADAPGGLISPSERFAQVLTPTGRLIQTRPIGARPLLSPVEARGTRAPRFIERGEETRLRAVPLVVRGRRLVIVVATSLGQREHALEGLARSLLIGGPLALLLAGALAYWIAAAALRSVESMRCRAAQITAAEPDARLPVPPSQDEIHRLATTLNEMLARLADAAQHERSFVANASHELRTPLANLHAELELALRHARTTAEFRAAHTAAIADTQALIRLANDLLVLAGEDGGIPLRIRPVELHGLLTDIARQLEQHLDESGRSVRVQVDRTSLLADPDRLRQALGNMADNAVMHGCGDITIGAEIREHDACLWVSDEGQAVTATVLATAFDRFVRGPHSPGARGAGLGLAIVREIAAAHGGHASLRNTAHGVICTLELPLARPLTRDCVSDGAAPRRAPNRAHG